MEMFAVEQTTYITIVVAVLVESAVRCLRLHLLTDLTKVAVGTVLLTSWRGRGVRIRCFSLSEV